MRRGSVESSGANRANIRVLQVHFRDITSDDVKLAIQLLNLQFPRISL